MFCKWCGKKISNNGVPCPSCGRNQDPLENGNGFWDLCTSEPKPKTEAGNTGVVAAPVQGADPKPKGHTDNNHGKTGRKTQPKLLSKVLQIATVFLLVIAMVMIAIGMGKVEDCFSELGTVRSDIANLKLLVNTGFDEITQFHSTIPEPEPTDPPEELPEKDEVLTIDELLENGDVLLIKTSQIIIKQHGLISETDFEATNYLYLASGDILTDENVKIYWQISLDEGDTWETISETVPYIVVDNDEEAIYRILCLLDSEVTTKEICYYTTTDEPDSSEEPGDEDNLPGEPNDPTGETTPPPDDSTPDNTTPEQGEDDLDPTKPVDDNGGAVG